MECMSIKAFKREFLDKLKATTAKPVEEATTIDLYNALGALIWEQIAHKWTECNQNLKSSNQKQVYYFSLEFLVGKFLRKNLSYLGMYELAKEGLEELGYDLAEIENAEKDPGLGNGGLGRLAACFLDSLSSLGFVGHGTGIRYNYGLFEQRIVDGYQVEFPDRWLTNRNVWEVRKQDKACVVEFGGDVVSNKIGDDLVFKTINTEKVLAVPYDTPILGYGGKRVNTLRLFSAEAYKDEFDFFSFSEGDYNSAFSKKHTAEAISQVLYPNDNYYEGRILRIKQEYFLVSAGIQTIVRNYKSRHKDLKDFPKYIALHINDTHPSMMIPEMMRIFMDVEGLGWDEAWRIVTGSVSYTNHTILSEAMEKWDIHILRELLPRITMIIEEIDRRFVEALKNQYHVDEYQVQKLRIIQGQIVNMANLCIVASNSVNGVAKLHTEILKNKELNHFYKIFPHKFNNKTNGITHRRWLMSCNPKLRDLISDKIGNEWYEEPILMEKLLQYKDDKGFLDDLDKVKHENKVKLAKYIDDKYGIKVDTYSIFDMQSKRLHEYKRQLMNALHIMYLCNQIMDNPNIDMTPRTFIFGAKAAPSYHIAKQIIKLINTISQKIEQTPALRNLIKVVFLENYNVSLAELMIPAADVSEQISTASKEASGTGNMKYMMNGAVTIGTLDGANVEIKEAVGDDNIYIFGMTSDDVYKTNFNRSYHSVQVYEKNAHIKRILDQLTNGFFEQAAPFEFQSIRDSLLHQNDPFFVLKDFESYAQTHKKLEQDFRNKDLWMKKSLTNIAKSGIFSSDYTIEEYAGEIWKLL